MDEDTQTMQELSQEHIHWGHLAVILAVAVALVFVTFLKNGFHLSAKAKTTAVKPYTYEMALNDAKKEMDMSGNGESGDAASSTEDQLAMIDPTINIGAVLGASTGTDSTILPDLSQVINQENLDKIKLRLIDVTDSTTIAKYKQDTAAVEAYYNSEQILQELQSSDAQDLKKVGDQVQNLVTGLLSVQVPKGVEEYHRYKIVYYAELSLLADAYAGVPNSGDSKDIGLNVFTLSAKLSKLADEVSSKYGVQL